MDDRIELLDAIDSGDIDEFCRCFEPTDIASDYFDGSLLHAASRFGTVEMVKFVIENGADVNKRGGTFDAPAVTYAADNGKLDIVRYLVEAGSVLDTSHALRNPLLRATNEGYLEVAGYLLAAGIDPHATYRTPTGALINALTKAEQGGHKKIVELLKAHGCHRPVEGVDIPIWEPAPERMVNQTPEFQQYQEIIAYMEERFGPADQNGMQELLPVMEGMSVAINIIRPNEEHPFLVLFTNGMSDLPMKVPTGKEASQYAELVIHLPPDWIHPRDANGDPQWMWPVQWLRKMAYYPHLNDTWLGLPAAIVSSDEPPVPLGPNTKQTCLLMLPDFSSLKPPLERADGNKVHFFTLVPLYTEERDYELQHGMRAFLERVAEREVPMLVDVDRPSFMS